jgi:hypothetical protein
MAKGYLSYLKFVRVTAYSTDKEEIEFAYEYLRDHVKRPCGIEITYLTRLLRPAKKPRFAVWRAVGEEEADEIAGLCSTHKKRIAWRECFRGKLVEDFGEFKRVVGGGAP